MRRVRTGPQWGAGLLLAAAVGCGPADSVGALARETERQENAVKAVQGTGAKITEKTFGGHRAYSVDLSGQQINEATFTNLRLTGFIGELNLSKTNLTDADMARVNTVANVCQTLDLSHTAVTDAGLAQLSNLIFLKELNLAGTQCTKAGVEALKKRLGDNPVFGKPNPNVKLK